MAELLNATGRRKTSVARAFLKPGSGSITINGRSLENYFPNPLQRDIAVRALSITDNAGKFDVQVNVHGGGTTGQAGAVRLAIARAIVEYDENARAALRKEELLTRDPRMVERKKFGRRKARRRFQFSKR
jgi:small subunit ribosomal protein S9